MEFVSTVRGGEKLCFEGFTYTMRSRKKNFVQLEYSYVRLLSHTRKNVILRFLTNCVCVKRLLIKFEVASVYGHYYSDLYFTLRYWSTGRGMSFYAILTVYAHY